MSKWDVFVAVTQIAILILLAYSVFHSVRHREADLSMARTIDSQRQEIESLRRRLKNGGTDE